jgi:hypothetical protein
MNALIGNYAFNGCVLLNDLKIECPDLNGIRSIALGDYVFNDCSNLTGFNLNDKVTSIGERIFNNCTNLYEINIGTGLDNIPTAAFSKCTNLRNVNIKSGIKIINSNAFNECINLTGIEIPGSVTKISSRVFYGCSNLRYVKLYNNPISISDRVFHSCTGLKEINIPDKIKYLGTSIFNGCINLTGVTLGTGIKVIDSYAFANCSNLNEIVLPQNLSGINSYCFTDCIKLSKINIPSGINQIWQGTFLNCKNLKNIEIGSGVSGIQPYAFSYCGLTGINIPDNVYYLKNNSFINSTDLNYIKIGKNLNEINNSFYRCTSLREVEVDSENETFSSDNGVLFNKNKTSIIIYPPNKTGTFYNVPNTVNNLNYNCFNFNYNLTGIYFSGDAPILDADVFLNTSSNLKIYRYLNTSGWSTTLGGKEVVIIDQPTNNLNYFYEPATNSYSIKSNNCNTNTINIEDFYNGISGVLPISKIQNNAFENCTNLFNLNIGQNISEIGSGAFKNCSNLNSIYFKGNKPYYVGQNILTNTNPNLKIYRYYNASGWSENFEGKQVITIGLSNDFTYSLNPDQNSYSITNFICNANIVNIPDSYDDGINGILPITNIKSNVFSGCENIININLPKTLTGIGDQAFYNCTNLIEVKIPDNVINIGVNAFKNCTKLYSLNLGNGIMNIQTGAFYNCSSLIKLNIPNSVKKIETEAFKSCSNLNVLIIGDNVETIESSAFNNCNKLYEINIGKKLSTIQSQTFANCLNLEKIIIPKNIIDIQNLAFSNCFNLKRIDFLGDAPNVNSNIFQGNNILNIYRYPNSKNWNSSLAGRPVLLFNLNIRKGLQIFGLNNSKGRIFNKLEKENLSILKSLNFDDKAIYIFKSASTNTLNTVLNSSQFLEGENLSIYSIQNFYTSPLSIGNFFISNTWLYGINQENANNYIIPNNSILILGMYSNRNISVGGGAIIQKYYQGKISIRKLN